MLLRLRLACLLLACVLCPPLFGQPAQPQVPPVKPQEILEVIQALKAQLLAGQEPDGSWKGPHWPGEPSGVAGGYTAVVCWGLLQAGQEPYSEPIVKAASSLTKVNMTGTYNRAMRCMVLASLARTDPGGRYAQAMRTDVEWLLQARMSNGRWAYFSQAALKGRTVNTPDPTWSGDNSATQLAILALREASLAGANVPASAWESIRDYWQGDQNEDGGFGYRKPTVHAESYGSMTAAGVASLFISEDMVRAARCCAGELPEATVNALAWLSTNFDANENPQLGPQWWPYWLYSVERVSETSGYRYFGAHDWFQEGAAAIIRAFRARQFSVKDDPSGPAFALIFLAKGVSPMVCNKLEFGDTWNPNPLDASHMTRYLAAEVFERHLNWQIIKLDAPLSAFQESPLLLVTTRKWPATDDELAAPLQARIREFCETGGTVLIDQTCTPDPDFRRDLAAFLERAWPGRRLRALPGSHPLYKAHFDLKPDVQLLGLGNGCREYILVRAAQETATQPVAAPTASAPAATGPAATGTPATSSSATDLSCVWQKSTPKDSPSAFQVAGNLYMYATDKTFRNKIEPRSNLPRDLGLASVALPVARLQHANNWNPCPLALPMLADALKARAGIGLEAQPIPMDAAKFHGRKVLVITGQGKLEWTAEQVAIVRDFIKAGGSVLGDALMGDKDFADSLRRLAAAALMNPARPIPDNDALITGKFSEKAFDLGKVQYSRTLRWRKGAIGPASLEGVKQGNRWVFLISPYDLTNGLTTARPYGVLGYEPDDATRIAANCMLYFARNSGMLPDAETPAGAPTADAK